MDIEDNSCSEQQYDFVNDGTGKLESLFLSEMKRIAKKKPDTMQVSQTLKSLALVATESWKGSHYSDHKKWNKLNKYFRRASNQCTSKFNIIRAVSFRIPLVNNHGKKFYYDRKGVKGELNLFYGNQPKNSKEREEMVQELIEKGIRKIRSRGIFGDLKSGNYSFVGIKIEVDSKSLYKNRIPTARVVVVLGARRMRAVRV
jgi:lysyl-tRNA synthetase class II